MREGSWARLLDAGYGVACLLAVVLAAVETLLGVALVGFGVVVLVVDWVELRVTLPDRQRSLLVLGLLTAPMLALWGWLVLVAETDLQVYFTLAGGVFFLQANREVVVFGLGPIELLRQGYPNLIGVCLVCSMLADPLIQFRSVLLALVAGTFVVRKAFVWNGLVER